MKKRLAVLLLVLGSLAPAAAQPSGDDLIPDTPEGEITRALLRALASYDADRWRGFITDHFTDDFRNIAPMEAHLNVFGELYDKSRGYEVQAFQAPSHERYLVTVAANLTGLWKRFVLNFEPGSPPRVAGLGVRSTEPPATSGSPDALSQSELGEHVDRYLTKLAEADIFSGSVLLAHEGRPLYAQAFGEADKAHGVPNRVDTKFSLGSMNKMFTAVAVGQLVERGALSLEDPLSAYVTGVLPPEAAYRIKIKHLLSHSSGLGDYLNEAADRPPSHFRTLDDFLNLVRGDTLRFEPGAKFSYSNAGYLLLGKVIEAVTGTSYYAYIRDHIYRPAGMWNAGAQPQDRIISHLAIGYDKEYTGKGIRFRNNRFVIGLRGGPAGGGYATAHDLLAFATALQNGKLLDKGIVDTFTAAKPDVGADRYGYGFSVDPEQNIAGHSGGFAGVHANMDMFLEESYVAVVLSNYRGALGPVRSKIRNLIQRTAPPN